MKNEKFEKVISAIFQIMSQKGPAAITPTSVSRISGVSRGWLYKYVGKSNEDFLKFTVDELADRFISLGEFGVENSFDELRNNLIKGTRNTFARVEDKPGLAQLYFGYMASKTLLGEAIRHWETTYQANLSERMQRNFKIPKSEADRMAEVLQTIQMALAHRSTFHPNPKNKTPDEWIKSWFKLTSLMTKE